MLAYFYKRIICFNSQYLKFLMYVFPVPAKYIKLTTDSDFLDFVPKITVDEQLINKNNVNQFQDLNDKLYKKPCFPN